MNIHDELDRLILRRRWIAWCDREWKRCDPDKRLGNKMKRRMIRLSERLAQWKPVWEQREFGKRSFDGAVP